MSDARPRVLVTNDDGIDCPFLRELIVAAAERFRVTVAAPAGEQSWIGRAFSRARDVRVESREVPGAQRAWAIHGTPSDCVNIALGHLVGEERPDLVLSGINIGFNVSMPLALSSGTIAGATEGAAHGIRAAAFSLDLAPELFERMRLNHGQAEGELLVSLRHAARHAVRFAEEILAQPAPTQLVVHNYNFPERCVENMPVENARPADLRLGSLYAPVDPGVYRFRWNEGVERHASKDTDTAVLARGAISHTVLNYSLLGMIPPGTIRQS